MCEQRAAASNVTSNFTVDGADITRNYAQKTATAISAVAENATTLKVETYFYKEMCILK